MKKLSIRQILFRVVFMVAAVALVDYVFPHHDSYRYEYEQGKPWRYGRLQADFDFPVYHPDSVIRQMEDSLRRQVAPIYVQDSSRLVGIRAQIRGVRRSLGEEPFYYLRRRLEQFYTNGILTSPDKNALSESGFDYGRVRESEHALLHRSADELLSEKQVFDILRADTAYGGVLRYVSGMRDLVQANLVLDTAAMEREYESLRKTVSASYKVVVAETRNIEQGQIVDAATFDVLESYSRAQEERMAESNSDVMMHVGQVLLISLLLCSMLGFFYFFRKWHHFEQAYTLVAVGMVVLMVALTAVASDYIIGGAYLVPIGVTTITLATFHGSRTAYWSHIVMVLLCSFIAPSRFEYLLVQSVVGIVIIFLMNDGLTNRSQLMRVCVAVAITYPLIYCAYTLANEGTLKTVPPLTLLMMELNALLLLMSYLIIFALEKMFRFMSGVTLVELCNLQQGLLLRLSQEAPGTFQHSLQLANIAAAAAQTIGAKSQLVRTGALYHDIGKLWKPVYYTENQMGSNPHFNFTTEESVAIIKRHVTEGVELAHKHGLPEQIVRFITTHHGRGLVKYFYVTWKNAHPGEEPDLALFTYEGPDPVSPEEAILMMGDGVEAASRSLKEYTEDSIRNLVNMVIDNLVASGRLNNAKITLLDIQRVKESFTRSLLSINHARIAYPKEENLQKKGEN
ncbi:MAG: HDIG domain-containing protein [Bacteroidales bacterium]|nr:HDIG domain-containing protein [Bacteroidales bacterium]